MLGHKCLSQHVGVVQRHLLIHFHRQAAWDALGFILFQLTFVQCRSPSISWILSAIFLMLHYVHYFLTSYYKFIENLIQF